MEIAQKHGARWYGEHETTGSDQTLRAAVLLRLNRFQMNALTLTLNGICLAYDFRALLLMGSYADQVAQRSKWPVVALGKVTLTLGVALFDRPFVFTPRSIITERNQTIEGEAVFDWLPDGGYHMPRSEVFGLNARGRPAQVFARDIDIESSPIAIVDDGTWVIGLIEIEPLASEQAQRVERIDLADRFRAALKCYRAGPDVNLEKFLL